MYRHEVRFCIIVFFFCEKNKMKKKINTFSCVYKQKKQKRSDVKLCGYVGWHPKENTYSEGEGGVKLNAN